MLLWVRIRIPYQGGAVGRRSRSLGFVCSFALVPVPVVQRADTKIMNAIQRMNRSQPGSSRIKGR